MIKDKPDTYICFDIGDTLRVKSNRNILDGYRFVITSKNRRFYSVDYYHTNNNSAGHTEYTRGNIHNEFELVSRASDTNASSKNKIVKGGE